jgi:chemotaxis protein methyltransferase CheR
MDLSQPVFDELRALVRRLCGVALGDDKAYLIKHRLGPVARAHGCRSLAELAARLRGPGGAALHDAVVDAVVTAETWFFRDARPFEAFRREALPRLGEAAAARRVRLWCAAASTGQEAYSLAMLVHDADAAARSRGGSGRGFSILASDISERVLTIARAGLYGEREVSQGLTAEGRGGVAPPLLSRFFERRGAAWAVRESVRRLVEFRRVNLVSPPDGLGPFDAIFCRNVLMYFDAEARRRACERLYSALGPGGWLVLGAAENLYGVSDQFEALRFADALVYRRPAGAPPPP